MNAAPRWLSRRVVVWSLYDVASSAFGGVVLTFFGLYFVSVVMGDTRGAQALWGAMAAVAMICAGLLAPVVGAWSDRRGSGFPAIAIATLVFVLAGLAMPVGGAGRVAAMAAIFLAAQVGYTLAVSVYDSMLVQLSGAGQSGRVSGFAWATGFLGGILALATSIAMVRNAEPAAQIEQLPQAFVAATLIAIAFAVPALWGIHGMAAASTRADPGNTSAAAPFRRVLATLRNWRRHPDVFRFLMAFFLMNDVLVTIMFFVVIVARTRFGVSLEIMLWLSFMYHVIAIPATMASGYAADRFGHKPVIFVQAGVLVASMLLLGFGEGVAALVASIALLGLVFGSMQAVCRSLLALLIPPQQAAEIFGFNAVAGRLSAAVGPLIFGIVASTTGSQGAALASVLPLLLAGVLLLGAVRAPGAATGRVYHPRA